MAFPFTQDGDAYWIRVFASIGVFAVAAIGLNVVVGLAGLLDLGYVAFFGVGAYVGALFANASLTTLHVHLPFLLVVLLGAVDRGPASACSWAPPPSDCGATTWPSSPSASGRSSASPPTTGRRHPGAERDRRRPQPGRRRATTSASQPRAARHHPARVRQLLLHRADPARLRHPRLQPAQRQPHRPGVGGHPGGRGGGRGHGRRHRPPQAAGLRHRRLHGRGRGDGERPRHHPGVARLLHLPGVDPAGGGGGAGRDGQHPGGAAGLGRPVRRPREAAGVPGQAAPALRGGADPDDAVPARGHRPQPPPPAGVPRRRGRGRRHRRPPGSAMAGAP